MAVHSMDDEKIIWKSYQGKRYRLTIFIRDLLFAVLAIGLLHYAIGEIGILKEGNTLWKMTGILSLLAIIIIGINQLKLLMMVYVITNERVIIKRGWLNRKLISIRLENIIDTKAEQSFSERLIRTGTVYLFTANDSQNSDDTFIQNAPKISNIDNPFERHSEISQLLKAKQ